MSLSHENIAKLDHLPDEQVEGFRDDLAGLTVPWKTAYERYQAQGGGWKTLGLMNSAGDSGQERLDGKKPIPTEALAQLPRIRTYLLEQSGLDILLARLAKVHPGGWMHEHHDDVDLGSDERVRLHIPIVTNPDAVLTVRTANSNQSVHLGEGELWKLNHERFPHSASNRGSNARVHLVIDCLMNELLESLIRGEELPTESVRDLPKLTPERRSELIRAAREQFQVAHSANDETAMRASVEPLLETFHTFNLEGGSSLELVTEMLECVPATDPFRVYWKERLEEVRTHRS